VIFEITASDTIKSNHGSLTTRCPPATPASTETVKPKFPDSETPYSANICWRKRFVKDASLSTCPAVKTPPGYKALDDTNVENQIKVLMSENSNLKSQIESAKQNFSGTVRLLEEKLAKAETSTMKAFKDKHEEILALKNVLKNYSHDQETLKRDLNVKAITCQRER
jgi:hypothetical protein